MSARKPKPQPKIQKNQNLQVFVRCRPLSAAEINQRSASAVEINGNKEITVQDRCNSKITRTFTFDKVFGPLSSQTDVYGNVVEPLISDVLAGFNCTVFAYGQTGSGKTFTMEGDFGNQQLLIPDSQSGLIPRSMCALFDELRVLQAEYTVRISLMELYNEELYDLLSSDDVPPKLRLFDDASKKGSVLVQGLQEVMVHTQSQVLEELRKGSAKRQVAATLMNAQSSRSHTIFTVTVHCKENSADGEEFLRTGKLNLVDLAGSENIGRSGSSDKRAREAASINQSLLTLSRVTSCLVEHQPHVPYRESKLTRLLQDSLGGRTKTSLIATISPSHLNAEETISTLDYALRAKCVSNKPEVNQKVSQNVIMKEYADVIESLKMKLDRHRNGSGVYVNDENYRQIMEQTQARNKAICDLIAQARAVSQKKKEAEEIFATLSKEKEESKINLENVNEAIIQTAQEIEHTNKVLNDARVEQTEAVNVLKDLSNKENELRAQAGKYVDVIDSAYCDSEKIHQRLALSRNILSANKDVLRKLMAKATFFTSTNQQLSCIFNESHVFLQKLSDCVVKLGDNTEKSLGVFNEAVKEQLRKVASTSKDCMNLLHLQEAQMKAVESGSLSSIETFYANTAKISGGITVLMNEAIANFNKFVSLLPQQSSCLFDFVQKSVENLKDDAQKQVDEVEIKLSTALCGSEVNVQVVDKLLDQLLLQEEVIQLKNHLQLERKRTSAIAELCAATLRESIGHKLEVQKILEKKELSVCEIQDKMSASVEYFKQQQNEIMAPIKELRKTVDSFKVALNSGVTEKFSTLKETAIELGAIATRSKNDVNSLLDSYMDNSISHIITECSQVSSGNLVQIKSQVASLKESAEETTIMKNKFAANYDELKLLRNGFEEKEDEIMGMLLDGISSAKAEAHMHFESGNREISEILSSEFSKDTKTGETPTRRPYGPIPEPAFLSSPVKRVVKSKLERAPWKKLLRSPRKPLRVKNDLREFDDDHNDGMASDSELSLPLKVIDPVNVHKASSLCDLRSTSKSYPVFHRPRIPKKIVRNPPV